MKKAVCSIQRGWFSDSERKWQGVEWTSRVFCSSTMRSGYGMDRLKAEWKRYGEEKDSLFSTSCVCSAGFCKMRTKMWDSSTTAKENKLITLVNSPAVNVIDYTTVDLRRALICYIDYRGFSPRPKWNSKSAPYPEGTQFDFVTWSLSRISLRFRWVPDGQFSIAGYWGHNFTWLFNGCLHKAGTAFWLLNLWPVLWCTGEETGSRDERSVHIFSQSHGFTHLLHTPNLILSWRASPVTFTRWLITIVPTNGFVVTSVLRSKFTN